MTIAEEIGKICHNEYNHFWTHGSWSLHELLEYIINQVGPSKVMIASYSASEESLRYLFNLREEGLITKLTCLFDIRTKKDKTALLMFAHGISDNIYVTNSHAKVIIIENESIRIAITGSANFTNNMRHECGMICTVGYVVDFYKGRLLNAIETATPVIID